MKAAHDIRNQQEDKFMKQGLLLAAVGLAAQTVVAADADWQTLSTPLAGSDKKCEMRVPAAWTLQEKGASFSGPYSATLVYEAEKPEVWWTKRKKVDLKDSRVFQDNKTSYWIEVQGALISGGDQGAVHISGARVDDMVCHAVLELKSEAWRDNYEAWQKQHGDMVREMMTSLKAM
jgi:hypothetical protein